MIATVTIALIACALIAPEVADTPSEREAQHRQVVREQRVDRGDVHVALRAR